MFTCFLKKKGEKHFLRPFSVLSFSFFSVFSRFFPVFFGSPFFRVSRCFDFCFRFFIAKPVFIRPERTKHLRTLIENLRSTRQKSKSNHLRKLSGCLRKRNLRSEYRRSWCSRRHATLKRLRQLFKLRIRFDKRRSGLLRNTRSTNGLFQTQFRNR